ncbi:MAG: DUF1566 domain-containing protein [Colwellia sp.]|nr:DUF1566 domain-containing protein [Colwellia sp.]
MKNTKYLIPFLIMYACVMFSAAVHAQCDLDSKFVYGSANNGATYYTDRDYTITEAGPFAGMTMIKTPNADRNSTMSSDYLKYDVTEDGQLYVAYDRRATTPPNWLTSTFSQIPCAKIETSLSSQGWLNVYKTAVSSGECVSMGANKAPGFSGGTVSNFIVLYSTTSVGDQCGGGGGSGSSTGVNPGVTSWSKKIPANERFELVLDEAAVLDHETGLVWEKSPSTALVHISGIFVPCITKEVGGRKGWRVPSIGQLASLVDSTQSSPSLPDGHPFSNTVQLTTYWAYTNSTNVPVWWVVNMDDGSINTNGAIDDHYVWCIRDGQGYQ